MLFGPEKISSFIYEHPVIVSSCNKNSEHTVVVKITYKDTFIAYDIAQTKYLCSFNKWILIDK